MIEIGEVFMIQCFLKKKTTKANICDYNYVSICKKVGKNRSSYCKVVKL